MDKIKLPTTEEKEYYTRLNNLHSEEMTYSVRASQFFDKVMPEINSFRENIRGRLREGKLIGVLIYNRDESIFEFITPKEEEARRVYDACKEAMKTHITEEGADGRIELLEIKAFRGTYHFDP